LRCFGMSMLTEMSRLSLSEETVGDVVLV